jgi:dTDP-4-dehydrorhamnose 3,5-epimerase-like enzyme
MRLVEHFYEKNDERGKLSGLLRKKTGEVNWVETKKGSIRGGHYHNITNEYLVFVVGRSKAWKVSPNGEILWERLMKPGEVLLIEPSEVHFIEALDDSIWINALDPAIDNQRPDIYKWNKPT